MSTKIELSIRAIGANAQAALEDIYASQSSADFLSESEVILTFNALPSEIYPVLTPFAVKHQVILETVWTPLEPEQWEIDEGQDQPSFSRIGFDDDVLAAYDVLENIVAYLASMRALADRVPAAKRKALAYLTSDERAWLSDKLKEA